MTRFRIQLLGGLRVVDPAGREVALPARKAQALLALLARRPGASWPRARLAGLLWPDRPDAQGRGSLRQTLAAIRRVLSDGGSPGPETRGDALVLPATTAEVDTAELEAALGAGDPARALAAAQGPFLDGFPPVSDLFDEWVQAERAGLTARALEAARPMLEASTAVAGQRVELAERALRLDRTFEPAWRARIRARAEEGDRAGALREYERCREALAAALGVEPSPATAALRAETAAPAAAAAGRRGPTLAVLPFEVRSDGAGARTFAEALADEVAVELSRFRALEVIAMESASRSELAALEPAALGEVLGAQYLLRAGVQAVDGRLRVAARLVEARTGRQVWAERHEGELAEVFAVQERIARAVAGALALGIDGRELEEARARPPERLDAYACCLRGMGRLREGSGEADREARALFQRALALAPDYARAYSGLSLAHFNDWSCAAWERWEENQREAFRFAAEAVRLDDRDHLAHYILARILLYRREWPRAEHHLERALALNPNDADCLVQLGLARIYLGEAERGLALVEEARRLHPHHPSFYRAVEGLGLLLAHRPAEAAALLEQDPDAYVDTRAFLAVARAHAGDGARAAEEAGRFLVRFGRSIAAAAGPDEAAAWVLQINPFRRAEDRAYVLEGLGVAGVPAREALAGILASGPPG